MAIAHELGLNSSATMMFGHVETIDDRVEHLQRLRDQQDATGGFTAFICWTFQPEHTVLKADPVGSAEYLRMQALSRIFLDNFENVQASWVTQGPKIGQVALKYGANDFGSGMMEENVVSAAGTTFCLKKEEIESLIRDAGYEVGPIDATDVELSKKLQDMYAGHLTVGAVSAGEIRDWVHDLPTAREALFYDVWGQPPSTIPVKGLRYGNVLVLLQDMKGLEDMTAIHDKKAPPSPWLLASYRYATRRFQADAMVHLGTHGLVEWSRGKEWSPAAGDYPEFLVDGCPHAYVYNVIDPVEASIARRRSYATILSHLCPPLKAVESSEDLRNLHRLVHDYYNTLSDDVEKRGDLEQEIREVLERSGLKIDEPGAQGKDLVGKVHDQLVTLEGEFAPTGQHVYGRNLSEVDRLDTFQACLEYADIDLYRLISNCYGLDYERLSKAPHERNADGSFNHEILDELREAGRALLSAPDPIPVPNCASKRSWASSNRARSPAALSRRAPTNSKRSARSWIARGNSIRTWAASATRSARACSRP